MERADQWWEEEVVGVDLRGRLPRNRDATAIAVSNGNSNGDIMSSAESANGTRSPTQKQEFEEEELQNSNNDSNNAAVIDIQKGTEIDEQERSEKSVYYDQDEGAESTHGFSGVEHSSFKCSSEKNSGDDGVDVTIKELDIQKNIGTVTIHQNSENLNENSFFGFSHLPSEKSFEEHNTNYKSFNNKTIEHADINLLKETYKEVTELDVEEVLEKQDTHDLYCPNCNSCITRRVILRKRKRKIWNAGEDAKLEKLETVVHSELDTISEHVTNYQGHDAVEICLDGCPTPAAGDYSRDREPDIFRCLSCFSYFIPTGNGFKLFQIFGDKSKKENLQNPRQIPPRNKNWFSSFFESGSDRRTDGEKSNVGTLTPVSDLNAQNIQTPSMQEAQSFVVGGVLQSGTTESQIGGCNIVSSSTQGLIMLGKDIVDVGDKLDNPMKANIGALIPSFNSNSQDVRASSVQEAPSIAESGGGNIVSSSTLRPTLLEKVRVDAGGKLDDAMKSTIGALIPSFNLNDQNDQVSSVQEDPPAQSYGVRECEKSRIAEPLGSGDNNVSSSTQGPTLLREMTIDAGEKFDGARKKGTGGAAVDHSEVDTVIKLSSSSVSNKMLLNHENDHPATQPTDRTPVHIGEPAENANLIPLQGGLKLLVPSVMESLIPGISKLDQKLDVSMEKENAAADGTYPSEASQHTITGTKAEIHTEGLLKTHKDALIQSVQGTLLLQEGQVSVGKHLKDMPAKSNASNDSIIVVEEGPVEPAASQMAQNIIGSAETGTSPYIATQGRVADRKGNEAREFHGLDIIKSIIYGGLIESITSLGVLSSAAGADAATLNVLALGLANLIGGLLIIGHNLWELKNDHSLGPSKQTTEQVDRYQEQLGQRENFLLHATVVVLSFLFFGLVPPITYGFSFRESDNRDLKLVAVASASLLCIIVLAIGKVYVQRPPKSYIKTSVYYVIMGFMVSGVSYIVGDGIKELVEKLGWFQSSLVVTSPLLKKTPTEPAWQSY